MLASRPGVRRGCGSRGRAARRSPGGRRFVPVSAVVEPVFNKFTSLPDGPLRSSVFRLAEKEGVEIADVLVADASRRTTTLNAYVSGFGSSRTGGALRQPRQRLASRRGASRQSPMSWRTPGTTTSSSGRRSARWGDPGCVSARAGPGLVVAAASCGRRWAGRPAAVPLVLALSCFRDAFGLAGGEHDQPGDRGTRRQGCAGGDGGVHYVRRHATRTGPGLLERSDPTGVEPVLVREPPNRLAARWVFLPR